jgi:hypothetical protein
MHRTLALTALLCVTTFGAQAQRPVYRLVEVELPDAGSRATLQALALDLASCTGLEPGTKLAEVVARDADLETLRASGLRFTITIEDLESHYARELARYGPFAPDELTPPVGQGAMGGHYTLAQMEAILDEFHADFPALCSTKVSLGKSIEGRDIWMVKISDNVAVKENEPEVLFDAIHHAREPLSMTTTLLFMNGLLEGYASDAEAKFIVDNRELYCVPCLNPDGYAYNERTNPGGGGMWRKNRRDNGGGVFGVDLNRNYATAWNAPNGGSSSSPSSDTYRGTAPFSEPETQAMEAFLARMNFVLTNSSHTYTDVLLRPWGWQTGNPPNVADYDLLGARFTAKNGLNHGSISALLYIASGSAVDHAHTAHGCYSWTPELGRSNEGGFWPTPPNQVAIATRHQHMFRQMALAAGSLVDLGPVTIAEAPGGNQNGIVEPGESGLVTATVTNDGLAAATTPLTLTLVSQSPGIGITVSQVVLPAPPRLSTTSNAGSALRFSVPAGYAAPIVRLQIVLTGDGRSVTREARVVLAPTRVAVDDDMERDRGFELAPGGTATSGMWERGAPQQTTNGGQIVQPGNQRTPGGSMCQVTGASASGSAGANDVDNGYTDLLSPVFDLAHLGVAEVTGWRWYAESQANDAFEIAVSNDGGQSWSNLVQDPQPTNAWVQFGYEVPLLLTDRVRFRFRAQDLNASLVEALIDDFAIRGIASDGSITLLSSGAIGTVARIGMNGAPGGTGTLLVSPLRPTSIVIPGIAGTLLLDPSLVFAFPSVSFGASGYASHDVAIPNDPGLRGGTLHWQMLHASAGSFAFGNAQRLAVR